MCVCSTKCCETFHDVAAVLHGACQAVVALSQDVDSEAVVDVIKSCDGLEAFHVDSTCHMWSVLFQPET